MDFILWAPGSWTGSKEPGVSLRAKHVHLVPVKPTWVHGSISFSPEAQKPSGLWSGKALGRLAIRNSTGKPAGLPHISRYTGSMGLPWPFKRASDDRPLMWVAINFYSDRYCRRVCNTWGNDIAIHVYPAERAVAGKTRVYATFVSWCFTCVAHHLPKGCSGPPRKEVSQLSIGKLFKVPQPGFSHREKFAV